MNRAGKYIENMTGEAMYKSFQPSARRWKLMNACLKCLLRQTGSWHS